MGSHPGNQRRAEESNPTLSSAPGSNRAWPHGHITRQSRYLAVPDEKMRVASSLERDRRRSRNERQVVVAGPFKLPAAGARRLCLSNPRSPAQDAMGPNQPFVALEAFWTSEHNAVRLLDRINMAVSTKFYDTKKLRFEISEQHRTILPYMAARGRVERHPRKNAPGSSRA